MGNCQAAEAATVLIQRPGGETERIYWSLCASEVMASNPGHYVAVIISSQPPTAMADGAAAPVKHLKLLRPNDTLHIGHVYRLVSFEEVLREFASKKNDRLSKFVHATKEKRRNRSKKGEGDPAVVAAGETSTPVREAAADGESRGEAAPPQRRMRQWKPALQSIEEVVGT